MIQNADVLANRLVEKIDMPANLKAAKDAGISMDALKRFMEERNIPRLVKAIHESGHRVSEIVNNMLSFARKSDGRFSSHRLEDLMDKTLDLAAGDFDIKKRHDFKKIEIIKNYDLHIPPVICEASMIRQVLLNIIRNAAYAMQTANISNPVLTVTTYFDGGRKLACLEIADNGPGMDEKTRERVFEPFFTTKPLGVGTGLGLSVSYFIITEHHKGEMTVESSPGSGARFLIRLP